MKKINAKHALFIKLGGSGEWEKECIENGTLRLGYREIPHDICLASDWDNAKAAFPPDADPGSVTRHLKQVQKFYEEPEETLWITFYSDRLWWCFSPPTITLLSDKSKTRRARSKGVRS